MFWAVVPFLWVNFVCILEKRLTLQQNVFVCWSFCLIQCFFGAVFLSLCFWVNRCYVLRERETLYCYRTVFVYFVLYHVCLVSCLFRCVCGSTDVMFWGRGRPYTAAELSARLHLAPENNIGEKDNGKEKILVRRTRHGICQKITPPDFPAKNFTTLQEIIFFSLTLQQLS